ncbi:MAG: M55 family metallopeptidase [Oscillospiraceae bacterium]|jgi:D-amino peptidase|nr:M55 family metallopeptidase [Oscillospiraceae bacterium]
MKKIYLSADIEGTCGIAHWDETEIGKPGYDKFAAQMSREVAAACEGAQLGGADELFVKDAHDSARNIDVNLLPQCAHIFRGWARDPYIMMAGLDSSFSGVLFTGYHSGADTDGNPLAHTMNGSLLRVAINGEAASELHINCLTAAMLGVPVLMVTGDEQLCEWARGVNPNIRTVPVSRGVGSGSVSMHPALAVRRIREAAMAAVSGDPDACRFPLPPSFTVGIRYREHAKAKVASFYPGARADGPREVVFETGDYYEALRFMFFCL